MLIKIVAPSSKKRLAIRQDATSIVGTDITGADGSFTIDGAAPPGDLNVFAGDTSIGEVTVDPSGTVPSGGNLGTFVEAPVETFVPKCALPSATVMSTGTVLAKVPLTNSDIAAVVKAADVTSAEMTRSTGLFNELLIAGRYYEVESINTANDAAIKVKLTPPSGQKIVISGVGIKSSAFSTQAEGFKFTVGTGETGVTGETSSTISWQALCPDDGQLHQVNVSIASGTQWDAPVVSLFFMNTASTGKLRFADLEIYGSVVEALATTGNPAAATTENPAAATTQAPEAATTVVPGDVTTAAPAPAAATTPGPTTTRVTSTTFTTTKTPIPCNIPPALPATWQQWSELFSLFMVLTDVPSSVSKPEFISNVVTWGTGLAGVRENGAMNVKTTGLFQVSNGLPYSWLIRKLVGTRSCCSRRKHGRGRTNFL